MRFLRFKRWLTEVKASVDGLDAVDFEAVKREGCQLQCILVVREDDHRLDFVERQFIRRLGERLYGAREDRHD